MKISIVIPVHNEEKNMEILHKEILDTVKESSYEIVFVDDGSTDKSLEVLKSLAKKDSKIKVVKLLSNYGQSNAIAAGIQNSTGEIIVTMDSDLQHDPKDIMPMVAEIDKGFHVVCGWRKKRGKSDSFVKKTIPSKISNGLIKFLTGVKLKDSTGGMRAITKKVVEIVPLYGEMHRYLPILANWKGFKITEIPINIRQRQFGKTKYNYKRILRGFFDLLTIKFFMTFSLRPFHVFGSLGFLSFAAGIIMGLTLITLRLFGKIRLLQETASLLLVVVLILMGIMFLGFGFIADMITHDAITSHKRETYIVESVIEK